MPLVGGKIWVVTWFPITLQKSIKFFLAYTKVQIEFHVIWLILFIENVIYMLGYYCAWRTFENAFSLFSWLLPTMFSLKSHMSAKFDFNPFFGAYKRSSHFPCLGWNSPLHKQFVIICSMDSINTHSILHLWTSLTLLTCPTSNYFGKKLIENLANIRNMFFLQHSL